MTRYITPCLIVPAVLALFSATALAAPIGALTAAASIVTQGSAKSVTVRFEVVDPLTRRPVDPAKPKRLGVQHVGEQSDLLAELKPAAGQDAAAPQAPTAWAAEVAVRHPGDYTFYGEATPLWARDEDQFIVLSAKVCVNVPGLEEGWDEPVGLELEIVPLSRPYGLWTGNLFSGQVLLKGEPAPYVEVTISRRDEPALPPLPADLPAAFAVQKVRADSNGVFHYAMPCSGWWGFTAWSEAEWSLQKAGVDKAVLLGTGYWVQTRDLPLGLAVGGNPVSVHGQTP